MEMYNLHNDLVLLCTTVRTFPNGISTAFDQLMARLPANPERKYFGISWMAEAGGIVYKAAAVLISPEEEGYGYEKFVLNKGDYLSVTIDHWMNQIPLIGQTFGELMKNQQYDPSAPCIEWYINDDKMKCMVKMKSSI